ncbi:hypothetical protein P7C71_g5328, partial [Lecanoromycetidae sp. Uapishka_2]
MGLLEIGESDGGSNKNGSAKTIDMALYSLNRAYTTLSSLQHKPKWNLSDTASFDCMHYDGDAALDHLATKLHLQPGQHILDIGSGFSATGRVLCSKYDVSVMGVELQREVHELAVMITERNEDAKVRKRQAARYLKSGGKVYIEDFYRQKELEALEQDKLQHIIACPYLPTRDVYTTDVEAAGFADMEFDDVSKHWTDLLTARAKQYRSCQDRDGDLEIFYDTVAKLFQGGNIGGVRLTATRI